MIRGMEGGDMMNGGWRDEAVYQSAIIFTTKRLKTVCSELTMLTLTPLLPPLLPRSVEFHQHGLVLRCQVVEVCVPELEHVSARRPRARKTGQQR